MRPDHSRRTRAVTEELKHACASDAEMLGSTRGIALISVLWIAGLLAVMAASFLSASRTEARLARNLLENAKAEALADAGVHRAALGLLELDPQRVWKPDGRVYRFALGEGDVQVLIRDEDGKIDLNEAPIELLAGLFGALDLDPETAQTMAERIGDFRDPDSDPEPFGAEDPAYLAAGLAEDAADRPFMSEAELIRVLGMTQELYERVRRHITVYAGSDAFDPTRATRTVLEALPGITPEVVERLLKLESGEDPLEAIEDEQVLEQIDPYWLPSRESVFTIRALGRTQGGGLFLREAVIELQGGPERPFLVYVWRQGVLPADR
jgi:general secretion pathway protein K